MRYRWAILGMLGFCVACAGGDAPSEEEPAPTETAPAATPEATPQDPVSQTISEALSAAREGRTDEAIALFSEIGPDKPQYPVALSYLANIYEQTSQAAPMLEALQALRPIEPENANVRFGISRAYFYLGRVTEAELAALESIEIDATQVPVRYHLGLVRLEQNKTLDAINTYLRAMEMPGAAGGAEAANRALENHLTERPELAGVYYAMALFGRALGRPIDERRNLERFLELESEGPIADRARENLARLQ